MIAVTSSGRGRRRAPDLKKARALPSEDKREIILRAAANLFIAKGFSTSTIDDLAADLNVTKPTIYYYFKSKDALLFSIQSRALDLVLALIRDVEAGGGAPSAKIRRFMVGYAEIVTDVFGHCIVVIPERALSAKSRHDIREGKAKVDAFVRKEIAEGIEAGEFRPIDVRHAAAALFGMINWTTTWRTAKSEPTDRISEDLIGIFLAGLEIRKD
jgi:AcrR family transcriptional regulator